MTSTVVFGESPERVASLACDVAAAGLNVLQAVGVVTDLLPAVQLHRPALVVCHGLTVDETLLGVTRRIASEWPCAVLVLTDSLDTNALEASVGAGVHACVPDGYSAHRLPALVQLARSRFQYEAGLTRALAVANQLLEERKVVDHAKSILMRARDLSDDDAFRLMRAASMHSNQRLADVSGHIIHAARFADGVNRAGQLRMLSQRLVRLQAARLLAPDTAPNARFKDAFKRIDSNLTVLKQNFAQPELVTLVKQVGLTWDQLKQRLKRPPMARDVNSVDALAEKLLVQSEALTSQLGQAGAAPSLKVLNLAGRQRMLSQRFAKFALLQALGRADVEPAMLATRQSFEKAQHYLNNIPLSTPEIGQLLAAAQVDWKRLLTGAGQASTAVGWADVESASEALLAVFERLSATYESSMQTLMG